VAPVNDFSALDDLIAKVQRLGELPALAELAAPLVEAAVRGTAAAGTSPDGTPWPPRRSDGARALQNAAESVKAVAVGRSIRLQLVGTSTGDAQVQAIQNAKRPILPVVGRPLPAPVNAALTVAARRYFARAMGGR
jgi:hypothetical protein